MPLLSYETLKKVTDNLEKYPIFIETGSYLGETIFEAEPYFKELHTIEIKKEFYDNLTKRYKGDKIHFHLGDSSIILKEVLKNLNNNVIFFLDGHWSEGNTGKGAKHVPLYEEIQTIVDDFKYECILIIDDYRLFGTGPSNTPTLCDWENIEKDKILGLVSKRLSHSFHLPSTFRNDDRLILQLNTSLLID